MNAQLNISLLSQSMDFGYWFPGIDGFIPGQPEGFRPNCDRERGSPRRDLSFDGISDLIKTSIFRYCVRNTLGFKAIVVPTLFEQLI